MRKSILVVSFFVLSAFLFLICRCGDTPTSITSITATPSEVVAGETSTISCAISAGTSSSSSTVTYTYSWAATGGSFTTSFGNPVTWTAPTTAGTYVITVNVSGTDGTSVSASVNIKVISSTESTTAPVINNIALSSTTIGTGGYSMITCEATSRVGSSESLSYSWSCSGGTLSSSVGKTIQWTAPATAGTYTIAVTVSDSGGSKTGTASIIVTSGGTSSVIKITSLSFAPATIYAGDAATFTCAATDSDGRDLTYAWTANGGTLASNIGTSVQWTAPTTEGTVIATVEVSDTVYTVSQALTIPVKKSLNPPDIISVTAAPTTAAVDASVNLNCIATDPNVPASTISYLWSASGGTFASGITSPTAIWSASSTGTYYITATVSNEGKSSKSMTIPVVVHL